MPKLLIIDDEPSICWGLEQLGASMGCQVETAGSAEEGLELAFDAAPDLIIMDIRLPGIDGLSALRQLRDRGVETPTIVITAHGDLETAVDAVRQGAFDYVVKPFALDQMEQCITRALHSPPVAFVEADGPERMEGMIGRSPAMQEVFKRIALAASSDACVLVCGESGTGKELAARAIHRYSHRAEATFVAVNVAALSESLTESELFGHHRGAFTGAEQSRVGYLEQANGGTLFLDEVADIPLPVQVKLLRALEHAQVTPVGATQPVPTDFRVVSATHQNLLQLVQQGKFRHDLYFRLCAFQIDIPPLRDRDDDILELAQHFARLLGGQRAVSVSQEAMDALRTRPWHGNVRELRNSMEHALILARSGSVLPEHLPAAVAAPTATSATESVEPAEQLVEAARRWAQQRLAEAGDGTGLHDELLDLVEPVLFEAALEQHQGQCASAARVLGMHRTTLSRKLRDYRIDGDGA